MPAKGKRCYTISSSSFKVIKCNVCENRYIWISSEKCPVSNLGKTKFFRFKGEKYNCPKRDVQSIIDSFLFNTHKNGLAI